MDMVNSSKCLWLSSRWNFNQCATVNTNSYKFVTECNWGEKQKSLKCVPDAHLKLVLALQITIFEQWSVHRLQTDFHTRKFSVFFFQKRDYS